MPNVKKFPLSHAQRELNRRGKLSLSCIVSDRWIRVGKPAREAADLGTPIEFDVMAAYSNSTGADRKLCSMIVTVDQLRAILAEIEKQ